MIGNFKHKGLKRLFEDGEAKGIRADLREKVEHILAVLNRASGPSDMDVPGFRLHPLKGDRKGFYGVTVRADWRVIVRFAEGHACDVELIDCH